MKIHETFSILAILVLLSGSHLLASERTISQEQLREKLSGFWIGQLAGNYVGFPFENLYVDEALPILIDRYYDYRDVDSFGLKMNVNDRRGHLPVMADAMGGAWSDDDTDIEFVTLHAIERYGLDLEYSELGGMWKKHVNRFIWSAARRTRDLIEEGVMPPATGKQENNEYWYRITSQLMTEIWGAVYPGMIGKASERGEWNARMLTDGWAVDPDIVYCAMASAAFFEDDPRVLVEIGLSAIDPNSPYAEGIRDVLRWSDQYPDWRDTRKRLHENYALVVDGFEIPYVEGGAVINGLCGIMALVYGEGDFLKTVGIATSAGYDCDNQAATCGGIVGIMKGASAIPRSLTHEMPSRGSWDKPFNDSYINYSRDGLPNYNRISDIVERLLIVAETAIVEEGGEKRLSGSVIEYRVKTDFVSP